MKATTADIRGSIDNPTRWFLFALAAVMLALWFPFIPNWQTFIHMWRVELAASLLLICTLAYVGLRSKAQFSLHDEEVKFIVLPILAFSIWSLISAIWAPSWKSAIHHSLVWGEYLILYIIFRQMLERNRMQTRLAAVFVLTLLLYALPAVVEYCAYLVFGGATTIGIRFAKYGEQVVTLIPLVLIWTIRGPRKRFLIGAGIVCALWLLVFCSLGRTNYLLFTAGSLAVVGGVMLSRHYRPYARRFAVVGALVVLAPVSLHVFTLFSANAPNPAVERFTDTDALASSGNFRRLMIALSGEMIRTNPVTGVGADNFGMEVNEYRRAYGAANPNYVHLAAAESEIPNHAHNEFLQIAAELGLVGAGIFAWLLVGVFVLMVRSLRTVRSGSLYPFAAVIGLLAFLASSLVSSYSFRVMQNGIVFFFVLAVASKALFRSPSATKVELSASRLRFACAAGFLLSLGLATYSTVRVFSVAITDKANHTAQIDDAIPLYELAMRIDSENPDARQNLGMRLFRRQRYAASVPYLEAAVSLGRAPSSELSYLATAKSLSGDAEGAASTMRTAAEMYPQSPFVLTRYSTLLERNGKAAESVRVFDRAMSIDPGEALAWRVIINSGPKALSELSARDKSYMPVMQLTPQASIYAVVTERYIRFPDEQRFSMVKVVLDDE
jgi:O-antigen ligase/Tfp pilus assembly protein PilF